MTTAAFVLHFYRQRERHLTPIVASLRELVDRVTICSNNPPPPQFPGVDEFTSTRNVGTGLQIFAALADPDWDRALFVDDDVLLSDVAVGRMDAALNAGADLAALWGRDGLVNGRTLMLERSVLLHYPTAAYLMADPFAHDVILGCLAKRPRILDEWLNVDGGARMLDDCGVGLDRHPDYDADRVRRVEQLTALGFR